MLQTSQGLLITPVQRLPRYSMLLERLEKYTLNIEERVRLQLAGGSIRSILDQIERELGNMLQQEAMTRLFSTIKIKHTAAGFDDFILDQTADGDKRKWEYEYVANATSYPNQECEEQQLRTFIVFQDIVLVCAASVRNKLTALCQLPIESTFAEIDTTGM
jgi:hypothetical protein